MNFLNRILAFIHRLSCSAQCRAERISSLRQENRECCFDEDARRSAILSMRDECWRAGV